MKFLSLGLKAKIKHTNQYNLHMWMNVIYQRNEISSYDENLDLIDYFLIRKGTT